MSHYLLYFSLPCSKVFTCSHRRRRVVVGVPPPPLQQKHRLRTTTPYNDYYDGSKQGLYARLPKERQLFAIQSAQIYFPYIQRRKKRVLYVGDDGVEAVETLKHSISRVVRLDLDGIPNHRRRSCMKDFERIRGKGFLSMSNEI